MCVCFSLRSFCVKFASCFDATVGKSDFDYAEALGNTEDCFNAKILSCQGAILL